MVGLHGKRVDDAFGGFGGFEAEAEEAGAPLANTSGTVDFRESRNELIFEKGILFDVIFQFFGEGLEGGSIGALYVEEVEGDPVVEGGEEMSLL